jgi:hypothetical protein
MQMSAYAPKRTLSHMSPSAIYAMVIAPWGNTKVPDILSEFPVAASGPSVIEDSNEHIERSG